jgi:hypothetical protein
MTFEKDFPSLENNHFSIGSDDGIKKYTQKVISKTI